MPAEYIIRHLFVVGSCHALAALTGHISSAVRVETPLTGMLHVVRRLEQFRRQYGATFAVSGSKIMDTMETLVRNESTQLYDSSSRSTSLVHLNAAPDAVRSNARVHASA